MALSREKKHSRELKEELDEKISTLKENLDNEEKEQDETEIRKVEELQETIENLKGLNDNLSLKMEKLGLEHQEEIGKFVADLEDCQSLKKNIEDLDYIIIHSFPSYVVSIITLPFRFPDSPTHL